MKLYDVVERVQIGSGDVISLDQAQMNVRGHRVTILERGEGEDARTIVRPNEMLDFKAGERIGVAGELPRWLADRLAEVKGASAADPAAPVEPADARREKLVAAIDRLDPESRKDFTSDGKPAVGALGKAAGLEINAAERDAAWALHVQREEAKAKA